MKSVGVDSSDLSRRVGVRVDFKSWSLSQSPKFDPLRRPFTFQGSVVGVVVGRSRSSDQSQCQGRFLKPESESESPKIKIASADLLGLWSRSRSEPTFDIKVRVDF